MELDLSCTTTSYQICSAFSTCENEDLDVKQEPDAHESTQEYSVAVSSSLAPYGVKVEPQCGYNPDAAIKEENPESPVAVSDNEEGLKEETPDSGDDEPEQGETGPEEGEEVEQEEQNSRQESQEVTEAVPVQLSILLKGGHQPPEKASSSNDTHKKSVCYCLSGSCPNRPYTSVVTGQAQQQRPLEVVLVLPPDIIKRTMGTAGAKDLGDSSQVSSFQTLENSNIENKSHRLASNGSTFSIFRNFLPPASKGLASTTANTVIESNEMSDHSPQSIRRTVQNENNDNLPSYDTESSDNLDDWSEESEEFESVSSSSIEVYKCSVCDEEFEDEGEREEHFLQHVPGKQLICHICGLHLETSNKFILHVETHEPQGTVSCENCGKILGSKFRLLLHMKTMHADRKFQCELCNKAFHLSANLKRHLESHLRVKDFLCSVCGCVFSEKCELMRHMDTHSSVLPFRCTECGKRFKIFSQLEAHSVVHTKKRPFKCSICFKTFAYQSTCRLHKRRHLKKSEGNQSNHKG